MMRVYTLSIRRFLCFLSSNLRQTRFFSAPFLGLLIVIAATVYTPHLSDRAVYCLVANYYQNTQRYTKWGDPGTGEEVDFSGKQIADSPFLAASRPAEYWATHGQHQAFLEFPMWGDNGRLVMNAPELGIHREFTLPITEGVPVYTHEPEFVWANDDSGNYIPTRQLNWSPDGRSVLFAHLEFATDILTRQSPVYFWHYSLFGLDGSAYQDALVVPQDHPYPIGIPWAWTSDSHVAFYPQVRSKPLTLPPSTESTNTAGGADRWLMVPHFEQNVYRLDQQPGDNSKLVDILFDVSGRHDTFTGMYGNLVADPDSVGAVNWSPDGKWFAIVWAIGKGSKRRLRLAWGQKQYLPEPPSQPIINWNILDDGLWDVRNPVWLADGHSLAFIAERKDGLRVEILNLNSGWHFAMRTGLTSIAWLNQNPQTGVISFWWRNQQNVIGIASVSANGIPLHDIILPLQIDGLEIFRDPYRWIRWPEIFPSPDGRVIAVYYEHDGWYSSTAGSPAFLELVAADGSWTKVVVNGDAQQMGHVVNVVWSPDGRYLMYARNQLYSGNTVQIDVFNPDGSLQHSFERWPSTSEPEAWALCP